MSITIRLQELRKKNKDSQEQLAEKLGVSRQAVSKWESGQGSPDLNNLVKISEVYEVSLDYLVKGIPDEEKAARPEKKMDRGLKKVLLIMLIIFGITLAGVVFLFLLTLSMQFITNL